MTKDEELEQLRQENSALRDQVALLSERISVLEAKLAKESHNSHLPPSSDRFQRQPKSLRKKSGKKPGGQAGHGGNTLKLSETPDQVIVHPVEHCQHCQRDLREVASLVVERRQVLDLPSKRVVVIEHQAQQKCCPTCHEISSAAFPQDVRAPVQYGAALGAVGVYLVQQQLLPYERGWLLWNRPWSAILFARLSRPSRKSLMQNTWQPARDCSLIPLKSAQERLMVSLTTGCGEAHQRGRQVRLPQKRGRHRR